MQPIEIRVKGHIDGDWSDWLGNLAIVHTGQGDTLIRGEVRDQAAAYGLLHQLSRLGLRLVSVTCGSTDIPDGQGGAVDVMTGH